MRLLCISDYRSGAGDYREGAVIDVSDSIGEYLLRDSPGSFVAEDEPKPEKVASVDRQQKAGRSR